MNSTRLLRDTLAHWKSHRASRMGAALSYYAIFSIAPLFILLIAVGSMFFNKSVIEGSLVHSLNNSLDPGSATFIQELIQNGARQGIGFVGTVISIVTIILGAYGVFSQLNIALDELWQLPTHPEKPPTLSKKEKLRAFVKENLVVFSVIPLVGALLLLSVSLGIFVSVFQHQISAIVPFSWAFVRVIEFSISFGLTTLLFAVIFKILPNVKLPWREITLGAAVTSFLFLIGRLLITLYILGIASTSLYGAAGSLVVLLIWIYYSAQVFFIGASFIFVYSKEYGFLKKVV